MLNYSSILISGPTASGKSKLAVRLAKKYNGVIINADAMQIYDILSIITARPTPEIQDAIPHFLYGYVNPRIRYSVGEWQKDIARLLLFLEKINILKIIIKMPAPFYHLKTYDLSKGATFILIKV